MKKLQLIIAFVIFSISINGQIMADFSINSLSTCEGTPIGFLDLSTSNGTINSWLWDFGDGQTSAQQNPSVNYLTSGNYNICLTVTDDLGQNDTECKMNFITVATVPVCIIDPNIPVLNCVNSEVTLDGSQSSSGPNFVYLWSTTNGNIVSGSTTPFVIVNDPGFYTLEVTDMTNGCSSSTTVTVIADIDPPIADAGPDMVLTCLNTSVTLGGSGSSTGGNIAYEWLDPNGSTINLTLNPSVSVPGVYTLIVTNTDNGCTATDEVIVTADTTIPVVSVNATTLVCPGELVTIDMIPGCMNCSIEIVDAMGTPVCTSGLPCEIDPADGPFQITVTDLNNGCQSIDNFTISVPDPIEITSSIIADVSCFGETDGVIDIEVSGGSPPYSYSWSNGSNTEDQVNLASGDYFVSIIDVNGCVLMESFIVSEPAPIQITNGIITNVSCTGINDGSIDITVTGGTAPYSYQWSNGGIPTNGLSAGIYNVTITDVNGCTYVSPDYEVIQNVCFDFSNDTTICLGEVVSLSDETPIAGWDYSWTPTTGLNNPTIPNPIASPSTTTTYSLAITDGNGAIIFNAVGPTITVQDYSNFGSLDFSNAPLCEGDTLELYGNTGLIFAWTGPNGFTSNEMDPELYDVIESQSGMYSLMMTDEFGCTASADVDVFIDDDCVWPGDTDTNMVVNHFDLLNIGLAYDSTGTTRENASFDWFGQPSLDWSQTTPNSNVNYKHIDADGNGIIEAADTLAITQNFGLTHNFSDPDILNQFTDLPPSDGFTVVTPFYVEPDTLIEGATMALDIILGDVSNMVMGLYGIGFSIEYDSSVVVPGSASINFENCWLGDVNADAISIQFDFHSPGRIDAAITRIDGMEMDGFGLFGELIITLEDDILLWNGGSNNFGGTTNDVFADFAITNYHLINFSQEEILVEGMTTTAPIGETTSLSFVELNELISVFPNPTNDLFFIASQKIAIERVRIFSSTGELKSVETKTGNQLEFSTKELASGIYFIEIQTREGVVTKKLFVQ